MTTAFGIFCVVFVVYANLIDLVFPHKDQAIHPIPVTLIGVRWVEYFSDDGRFARGMVNPGYREVGKRNGYIIGFVDPDEFLCPFVAPRADLGGRWGRVKIRIDGNIANVTEGIPINDSLNHEFFTYYHRVDPEICIDVLIPDVNVPILPNNE